MPGTNTYMTAELAGIKQVGDYVTPGTDKLKVQALIDLIEPEYTQVNRGLLDQISPEAQRQLMVELKALFAAVT